MITAASAEAELGVLTQTEMSIDILISDTGMPQGGWACIPAPWLERWKQNGAGESQRLLSPHIPWVQDRRAALLKGSSPMWRS
jgi:hypothetical protein